jgi:hypothetical protein
MTRRSTSPGSGQPQAAPAKKAAAKGSAKTTAKAAGSAAKPAGKGLLRAGMQALGSVRDDVVKRQSNLLEQLLGCGVPAKGLHMDSAAMNAFAFPGLGLRKFEDVFDQRIAAALQRMGMPSTEELQALRREVEELRRELEQLKPRPAAKRRAAPGR